MKTTILILSVLIFNFSLLLCQKDTLSNSKNSPINSINSNTPEKLNNYLGFNAGFTTGVGISYVYWPEKDGFQVTFLPVVNKTDQFYSLGLTYLRLLRANKGSKFFLYGGMHYTNFASEDEYVTNIGIGPGLEFNLGEDIPMRIMVGYGAYNIFHDYLLNFTIEWGLFYRF